MFQILGLLDGTIAGFIYSVISNLYSTVARIYDIMLQLVQAPNDMFIIEFGNIIDAVYVAAGVFMLFRVMISMIQMFLNPDLVTDNQAGAGKLLTRIVVSIALLILLQPSSFILGENGMLQRIESAMVGSDGFITNLSKQIEYQNSYSGENNRSFDNVMDSTNSFGSFINSEFLIENVYANTGDLSCYYFGISSHKVQKNPGAAAPGQSTNLMIEQHFVDVDNVYKIDFYKSKANADKTVGTAYPIGNTNYYYKVRSGTNIGGVESYGKYSKLSPNVLNSGWFSDGFPSSCPKYLKDDKTAYTPRKNLPSDGIEGCDSVNYAGSSSYTLNCENIGIMGGYESYSEFVAAKNSLRNTLYNFKGVGKAEAFIGGSTKVDGYDKPSAEEIDYELLQDVDNIAAIEFAQTMAGTFISCPEDNEECNDLKDTMFQSMNSDQKIVDAIASDIMTLDFFTALITGLILIAYLVILCVDVIVRRLKLLLLEMISPIPVISYIDPKDKMLGTWFKMYMSTYADLFIKLIALALLVNLLSKDTLDSLWGEDPGLFVMFLYIVAILVFAKVVPSMISKIFGLEGMGGSFKDILGMGKAAAGFGAGAVIGAAAGAATGKGLGRLSGLTKGAMMGAGSGAKGNITGGSQKIAAANKLENDGKDSGLNFFQRKMAGATAALGVQDAYSKAKAKKQVNDDFVSKASAYEDEGLNKVNKVIGNGFGNKFKNLVEARNDAQQASMTGKASLLREVDNGDGTTSFVNKLTGDNYATYNTSDVTDDMRSHFLDADNYSMSAAEAQARVKGAEKKASKQLRDDLAAGKYAQYGFKSDDADLAEMSSLKQAADSAAVRAGYKDGYTKDNKDAAKRISAEQGAIMDQNEAAHMYSERK